MIPKKIPGAISKANVCDSYDFERDLSPLNHSHKFRYQIDHPLSTYISRRWSIWEYMMNEGGDRRDRDE